MGNLAVRVVGSGAEAALHLMKVNSIFRSYRDKTRTNTNLHS